MKNALKVMSSKKLGVLVVKNKKGLTIGVVTDGDLRRAIQKNKDIKILTVKNVMTKTPISIDRNELAAKALYLMNSKKISVNRKESKNSRYYCNTDDGNDD